MNPSDAWDDELKNSEMRRPGYDLDRLAKMNRLFPREARPRRGSTFRTLAFLAIAGALIWAYFVYRHSEEEKAKRDEAARKAKVEETQRRISEFAARYGALTDWRKALASRKLTDTIYSAEVNQALITPQGQPVLFIGSVQDVNSARRKVHRFLCGKVKHPHQFQTASLMHV